MLWSHTCSLLVFAAVTLLVCSLLAADTNSTYFFVQLTAGACQMENGNAKRQLYLGSMPAPQKGSVDLHGSMSASHW